MGVGQGEDRGGSGHRWGVDLLEDGGVVTEM